MTLLLYGAAARDPVIRHEIGEPLADPAVFIEHDGKRIVVAGAMEEAAMRARDDVVDEFWTTHSLDVVALTRDDSFPDHFVGPEIVRRALERVRADSVIVPPSFGVAVADYLRDKGIEVRVDHDLWRERRRQKTPWELEGIERAQRAADTAMLAAARMLREAEPTRDGRLRFEGEILTAELLRDTMHRELRAQGAETDRIIVQSGRGAFAGHDEGTGDLVPHAPCIIDVFPRDVRTGAFSDMTRTFVPGRAAPDYVDLHDHCRRALQIGLEAMRPGPSGAFGAVCDYFESHGFPTKLHQDGAEPLTQGFAHGLGHGIGLEVHEPPSISKRSVELREGDVVTVEPGLYFDGIGGVRLEDTVIVTSGGPEHFTDPYPYDLEP